MLVNYSTVLQTVKGTIMKAASRQEKQHNSYNDILNCICWSWLELIVEDEGFVWPVRLGNQNGYSQMELVIEINRISTNTTC